MGSANEKSLDQLELFVYQSSTSSPQLFDFQSQQEPISFGTFPVLGQPFNHYFRILTLGMVYIIMQDSESQFTIIFCSGPSSWKFWKVLRPNTPYPLQIGSFLKIGKLRLLVKEAVIASSNSVANSSILSHYQQWSQNRTELSSADQLDETSLWMGFDQQLPGSVRRLVGRQNLKDLRNFQLFGQQTSEADCRICFQAFKSNEKCFNGVCSCQGSMKYVHRSCLEDWIRSKVKVKAYDRCTQYTFQEPHCDICFDTLYNRGDLSEALVGLKRPKDTPYILFESVEQTQDSQWPQINLYLAQFNGQSIEVGRNSKADLVINDISISRRHCVFKTIGNHIFVTDCDSKFGTLQEANSSIEFTSNETVDFQFGQNLFRFGLRSRHKCPFSCCSQTTRNLTLRLENIELRLPENEPVMQE